MRRPGEIENVKKKIHARTRKMFQHGIGKFVWANGSGRGGVGGSRKKFSGRERRAKRRVRLHRARGSAELKEVASGSATQGFWLINEKVGSQVSGIDRSRFPGRRAVREVRRGGRQGRRANDIAKKRALRLSLTALSISADHHALGWRLMRPKGMEDLAAFSAREVKRAAAEERERDKYSSAYGQ